MLDEIYKENQLSGSQGIAESNITLGIDCSGLGKTQKVKKTMSEEEAEKVRAENEKIRKERDEVCDKIATKFAQFKRDFLSAPIRKAMKCVVDKKGEFKPC